MSLKPKTFRRLALAAVLFVLAIGSIVAFVFVRQWQRERTARVARAEGMALYEKHDYFRAADRLRASLRHDFSDAEAWRVFGDCWEKSELPELKNYQYAKDAYTHVYELDPADRASALRLLTLYNRVGLYQEAILHAARLRPASIGDAGPADFEVLREEASARVALKLYDDRLRDLADRMLALRPDDFGANAVKAGYLRENHRGGEAMALVKGAAERFPDNRGLALLAALVAFQEAGSPDTAPLFDAACRAASLDPSSGASSAPLDSHDKEFIYRLVGLFDSLSRFEHSESLLRAATAAADADREVLRLAIRRTWQVGKTRDVADRLSDLDLSAGGDHSDLLAFKAMAQRDLNLSADARPLVDALRARSEFDYRARSWLLAFEAVPGMTGEPELSPVETVQQFREALKESGGEPVIAMLLGQALFSLGRAEEAFEAWKTATDAAPGWGAPFVDISRACMDEGRANEALAAAEQAMRAYPTSLAANVAYLNAQAAVIESGTGAPGDPVDMARRLDAAARQTEGVTDPVARRSLLAGIIPARAVLAVRSGRADEARAIIREAIAAPGEPDRMLMRRLALLSAREKLGLEAECFARADDGVPATPAAAFTRALALHESGRTAEGADLLRTAEAGANGAERVGWSRALAQYLDAVGDPAATDAWKALCDANPSDLSLQLAALRAPSSARDMAFVERITERANRLSNSDEEHPLFVARLAKARALLLGPPSVRARDEAVSILRSLTLEAGDGYQVRSLLVAGLLMDDPANSIKPDTQAALEELRTMQRTAPDKSLVALQMASILQRQREFDRARDELRRIANEPGAAPDIRQRAIDMLIGQADFEGAVTPFAALLEALGDRAEPARWLRLAAVHRALKQDAQALEVYRRLALAPPDDSDLVAQIADGLASVGRRDEAERVLSHVDTLRLDPGQRELVFAVFWSRRNEPALAEEHFEKAIVAAPDRAEPWVRYAQFRASRSEHDRADELIGRGLAALPGNPELRLMKQQLMVRRSDNDEFNMADFAAALEADPATKSRAEIVRAVEEMRQDGRLAQVKGIDELRAKYPADMSVQTLAIRLYLRLRPARPDLAGTAAKEALTAFPTAPEPAMLAAEVFRGRADWPEMLKAAQRWQQLSRSPEADLSVAEAHLNLNQTNQASEVLRPLVQDAIKDHSSLVAVATLNLYARTLATAGRSSEALELLRPMFKDSADVRIRAAIPVAVLYVRSDSEAAAWLEAVEESVPADDASGRLALSAAWGAIATRAKPPREDYFDRAVAAVMPLTTTSGPSSAPAHEAIAAVRRQRGDARGAAESYQRSLAADPRRVSALIGLADLLMSTGGDPAEAVAVAERAVAASGSSDPAPRRLLGRALANYAARLDASGRAPEARSLYQRAAEVFRALAAADPSDVTATLGLAHVSDAVGDMSTAVVSYERVLSTGDLPPQTRAGIQNNLAYALLKSAKDAASLDRARTLATQAVAAAEVGAFYDTLGCVEAARGDHDAAAKAFARAIEIDSTMNGSRIELAAILSARTGGDDRARAKALLDEAAASGALSTEQSRRAREVRAALDKPE